MHIFSKKSLIKKNGQVSVVILLIVAFALIFYAVTLNLGRVGQNKTSTQIGSNQGAASLASAMASYGHSLLMTQLGGERKKCASTGLLGAIVGAIIAIILLVVAIYTVGATAYVALAVVGAVLSVANVVLQVTVIQPGITSAWNSLAAEILPLVDQFMESALRNSMQNSTNDSKQVPDLYDFDTDGSFGLDGLGQAHDVVSRFSLYWNKVFEGIVINFILEAEVFQIELQNFVYQLPPYGPMPGTTTDCGGGALCAPSEECVAGTCQTAWGLYDPLPQGYIPGPSFPGTPPISFGFNKAANPTHPCFINPAAIPSVCSSCCLPETSPDPRGPAFGQLPIRPGCCDCCTKPPTIDIPDPTNPGNTITVTNPDYCGFDPNCGTVNPSLECGTASTCQALSPYGAIEPTLGTFYQWVYDVYVEDYENAFFSFRELIGRDDEHQLYFKDSSDPNWAQQFAPPWNGSGYYVDDTTGFYSGLTVVPPAVAENRIGIFPFLYMVSDWGFDLDDVITGGSPEPVDNPNDQRCKWCDANRGVVCNPNLPYLMTQLDLVQNPLALTYQTSYCVDTDIDDVTLALTGSFEMSQDICADPYSYGGGPFWKRGADRFCSEGDIGGDTAWPYEGQCRKYYDGNCFLDPNRNGVADCPAECDSSNNPIPALCECGDPSAANPLDVAPALFPEDLLDDMVYDLTVFIAEANKLLGTSRAQLSQKFTEWFNDWQAWIDPGPLAGVTFPASAPNPYGQCYPWDSDYDPVTANACQTQPGKLYIWHNNIELIKDELVNLRDQSFQGAACGSPWCIPPRGCPGVSPYEEVTFDANGNGIDGDLEDIVACMNFNVEGYDYACNGGVPDISCVNGPGTNQGNTWRYLQCMLTCSSANCSNLPRSVIPLATYDPSAYVAADPADEPDMLAMLQCVYNCSNVSCTAMPATQSSTAAAYPYQATIGTFDQFVDCTGFALNNTNNFRTLVRDALVQANPICDINSGGWLQLTGTAAIEAQNHSKKLEMRRDYLSSISTDLNSHIPFLITASNRFSDFLTGPVADLIQARFDYDADPPDAFPFHVVYGWQDEIPPQFRLGAPGGESYWHITKVEGRMPKRCDNACGLGGGPDPEWPKVRTYTEKGGFKRCYELVNTDGIVKFRVTRFDESPNSTAGTGLVFPNGQPLWKFKYFHPNPGRADMSAATLGSTCEPIMITDPAVPPDTFKGAFLMNKRIGAGPAAPPACVAACGGPGCPACSGNCLADCGGDDAPGNNWNCWNRSHAILANAGIASETCAQYYYKDGVRPGLTFSFIDCPAAGF
ncbi:MAG: hypothetical protein AB7S78_05235 [Candidatus Omnitrophota bacterium]